MKRVLLLVAALVALTTGCGQDGLSLDHSTRTTAFESKDLVELLRATNSFDFQPFASPRELAEAMDIALLGEVISVDVALADTGAFEPMGVILIGLHVQEQWKPDSVAQAQNVAYVQVFRPANLGAELYRDLLPPGSRLVVFGERGGAQMVDSSLTDSIYSPSPQGFMPIDRSDSVVSVWSEDESRELPGWRDLDTVAELRQATTAEFNAR